MRGGRRASESALTARDELSGGRTLRLLLGIGSVTAGDRSFLLSLGLGLPAKRGLLVGQRALALRAHAPVLRIAAQLGGLLAASLQPASTDRTAQQHNQHDHHYDSNDDGDDGSCAHAPVSYTHLTLPTTPYV